MAVQHKLNGTSQRERRNALSQLPRQKAADPTATGRPTAPPLLRGGF
nr:MAG TPA: hypothetical protein [Caudoviricetes sp.]